MSHITFFFITPDSANLDASALMDHPADELRAELDAIQARLNSQP